MRTAGPRTLRAPLALWLAVLLACVQATSGAAWAPCAADEPAAGRDEACCCANEQAGGGCCDDTERATRRDDRLVDACGCSHRGVPAATAQARTATVEPDAVVSLPEPFAEVSSPLPCSVWREATRPAPDPPPPRARA